MPVWLLVAIGLALALHYGSPRHEAGSDAWWSQTLVICLLLCGLAVLGLLLGLGGHLGGINHVLMQRT